MKHLSKIKMIILFGITILLLNNSSYSMMHAHSSLFLFLVKIHFSYFGYYSLAPLLHLTRTFKCLDNAF